MIPALVIGACAGVGFLLLSWAVVPPRVDLAAAVGRFESDRSRARAVIIDQDHNLSQRIGLALAALAGNRGLVLTKLRADLALLDRPLEQHLVAKLTAAGAGLAMPALVVAALAAASIDTGWTVPALFGLILAAAFSFLPDVSVTQAADARRNELRRALSCYLDLVSMSLAGGRGVAEALPASARIGQGWAFDLITETLSYARYAGITPWQALGELGERVEVGELRDLGNALSLVSDDGAKVKESLRARAATARARQLAEAEGQAEKASESIRNAHLMLGLAFLVFLTYPATAAVMAV